MKGSDLTMIENRVNTGEVATWLRAQFLLRGLKHMIEHITAFEASCFCEHGNKTIYIVAPSRLSIQPRQARHRFPKVFWLVSSPNV